MADLKGYGEQLAGVSLDLQKALREPEHFRGLSKTPKLEARLQDYIEELKGRARWLDANESMGLVAAFPNSDAKSVIDGIIGELKAVLVDGR